MIRLRALPGVLAAVALVDCGAPVDGSPAPRPLRRQRQSAAARELGLALLREAGAAAGNIGRGSDGQPLWPAGYAGSLAHTEGHAAAAVCRVDDWLAVGIDIEPDRPLPPDTDSMVLRDEEREWVADRCKNWSGLDRAIFCAKECVHKAIHPLRGAWLDFQEVRIGFDQDLSRFTVEPVSEAAAAAFGGLQSWGVIERIDGHIVAVLALRSAA